MLLAPLRPLADVLDLTAEAVAAVGTVSVAALGVVLARTSESDAAAPAARGPLAGGLSRP